MQHAINQIEKLLLRYHSDLKILYKQYTIQSHKAHYVFSMSLKQFWKCMYECGIMPHVPAVVVGVCLQEMHRQHDALLRHIHATAVATPSAGQSQFYPTGSRV